MKKLMIMLAVAVASVAVNAASFRWSANSIYNPVDSTVLYSGTASLYCDAIGTDPLSVVSVVGGSIANTTFSNDEFAAGTTYDFYFVIEDKIDGKDWTYTAEKSAKAQASSTPSISFGNQTIRSTTGGGWTTAAVPEPTSGLLMLLGMAGLALRRRRRA